MTWHVDGVGGGGGRIATEFWNNTNIELKGGWIDADPKEPKKKWVDDIEKGKNTGYYIFTRAIADLEDTIKMVTGQRIDIDGYSRRPELPMTALSIEKVRDKIVRGIADKIFKNNLVPDGDYESILFTVAFGGGTGTGIINPISEILRKRTGASIYALGALSESVDYDTKNFPLARRCFNTAWALRNLLIKTRRDGVDAVFLVDNDVLEGAREEKNRQIFESLLPMMNPIKFDDGFIGTDLRDKLTVGIDMPQIIVPCYYAANNNNMEVRDLLERTVENKLMDCDHTKADSVIVFTSLRFEEEKEGIEEWMNSNIKNDKISEEKIHVCRVWNLKKRAVLMLLRNPYGGGEKDPFYMRLTDIIEKAKEYAMPDEKGVNADILKGFENDVKTKLSDFIIDRLIPDLEE